MNGIINVLKPTGMTSHDVVSFIRRTFNIKKVGHTGTLDPNASGVLPICIGKGTKISNILTNSDKEYVCEVILGSLTDTKDRYGNILKEQNIKKYKIEDLESIPSKFIGQQYQKPPMFSALKYKGRKLYEYARENIVVDKPARLIEIKNIEIISFNDKKILLKISCSKGTYIRTLCEDIAAYLGSYGHMGILIRTKSKNLDIKNSLSLNQIDYLYKTNQIKNHIIRIDEILKLKRVNVSNIYMDRVINGNVITVDSTSINDEPFFIYCNNLLIGIGEKVNNSNIKIKTKLI